MLDHADLKTSAREHLQVVRDALAVVLSTIPDGWGSTSQLASGLGVERTLAWKLSKIASAPDPLAIPQHLPGDRAMNRVFDQALQRGVDGAMIERARTALACFRDLGRIHAGDGALLELMVGGQTVSGREDMDLDQRRAAFRANSYMLGVSLSVLYDGTFVTPGRSSGMVDIATVRGLVGLGTMRDGVMWPVSRKVASLAVDGPFELSGEPLFPEDALQGAPVMKRFSSPTLGPLVEEHSTEGYVRYLVAPGLVGKSGAVDTFLGEVYRNAVRSTATPTEPNHTIVVRIKTPARRAIIDQFIHRDLFGPVKPSVFALSLLFGEPDLAAIHHRRGLGVPLFEEVQQLHDADRAVSPKGVAAFRHVCDSVVDRLGCRLSDFLLYRVELEYPPQPVAVVMSHPLAP